MGYRLCPMNCSVYATRSEVGGQVILNGLARRVSAAGHMTNRPQPHLLRALQPEAKTA